MASVPFTNWVSGPDDGVVRLHSLASRGFEPSFSELWGKFELETGKGQLSKPIGKRDDPAQTPALEGSKSYSIGGVMKNALMSAASFLAVMAASAADAGPMYTTTDLGVGFFSFLTNPDGSTYGVTNGAGTITYAFDKTPTTAINVLSLVPNAGEVFQTLTLQHGSHSRSGTTWISMRTIISTTTLVVTLTLHFLPMMLISMRPEVPCIHQLQI